jgi:ribulose-5-phosphate 4-epimerase/fuculose-1-phosphate aldolase
VRDAVILRGRGSLVAGKSLERIFAGCVDLEESAARLFQALLLGPVRFYTGDEVNRVVKGRRKEPVIRKIWNHYVAKVGLAGLLDGL